MENKHINKWHLVGAALSLALVSLMTLRVSDAAFSATTNNSGNQWTAGDVILEDDDANTAMFVAGDTTANNMKPGATSTKCITVTYTGTLDASVKLYGNVVAGTGLEDYLDLTIYRGNGGAFGNCAGFVSSGTVYSGTLADFASTHSSFATGAGSWNPTGGGPDDPVTYQFVMSIADDNSAQSLTATAMFTWEAQNL